MRPLSDRTVLLGLGLFCGVFFLDLISKYVAQQQLASAGTIVVIPWFLDLQLVFNRGISFGLFAAAPGWSKTLIIAMGIVFSLFAVVQIFSRKTPLVQALGWALFAAGAAGNVWERIRSGAVTDFLSLKIFDYHVFVFNIADFSLTIAVIVLFLTEWLSRPAAADA